MINIDKVSIGIGRLIVSILLVAVFKYLLETIVSSSSLKKFYAKSPVLTIIIVGNILLFVYIWVAKYIFV